jgi:hypothetical protein
MGSVGLGTGVVMVVGIGDEVAGGDGVTGGGIAEGAAVDKLHDNNNNAIKAGNRFFIGFTRSHVIPALEVK